MCQSLNGTILPAMLYTSEILSATKKEEQRQVMAQGPIERSMLGISSCEHIRSE